MRDAIASTYIYNIIIIFIVIIFAFVMGTMVYYKSFKTNKSILSIIEKYEGYNTLSQKEIKTSLESIGYSLHGDRNCPVRDKTEAVTPPENDNYNYCVYYFPEDGKDGYYSYGVITYISFDFPFFNIFIKLPVYTRSNRIFRFGE